MTGTIHAVLDRLRDEALDERDKGSKFEQLIRAYLTTDPEWTSRFSDVWLWSDWPGREGRPDTGIDLVAANADGDGLTVIQCEGRTTAMGLDIDTLYGQLLRRMGDEPRPRTRFAVVVPSTGPAAAKRVPTWVRSQLGIDVYAVHEDGRVELHGSTALTDPDNLEPVLVEDDERN